MSALDVHEAGLAAVRALVTALVGRPGKGAARRVLGQMSRLVNGDRHLWSCNQGLWLQAGDSLRGGQPCSERCRQAQDALLLAERFLELVIAECEALAAEAEPVQQQWALEGV